MIAKVEALTIDKFTKDKTMPATDVEKQAGSKPPIETGACKEEKDEPKKLNKVGVAAFLIVYIIILVVGGILNAQNSDADVSKTDEGDDADPMGMNFNRISTTPVCLQWDADCNIDNVTVAEIVYATDDGNMVAYTDGQQSSVGFIDISDPSMPVMAGTVNVGGETTSLVIKGNYVAVGVSTSPDFVNPSGNLQVIDISSKTVVTTIDMMGQPDSVALSPDKNFIVVAIENERDEDFNNGLIPQLPAGFLQIVDCSSADPAEWVATKVELTGLDGVSFPSDPEPEFVAINADNVAVVTLQENNAIVLVDLATATVMKSFSAGTATVDMVDVTEDGVIDPIGSVTVPREPDGVTWIGTEYFATADEGDLDGGSRGFTIFDTDGNVVYENGNEIEQLTIRYGHYPDERSENKGNEPENVVYAEYGTLKLLFVGSERSSLVFVYEVSDVTNPVFRQILPTGVKPEGAFAIPSRNLLVVAAEEDARGDKMRSAVSIYELQDADAVYPHLVAADGEDGKPIAFSALSGLSFMNGMLYSVDDSFYKMSRMFAIDVSSYPYTISKEVMITDPTDMLADVLSVNETTLLLNSDTTVNLDLEGIEAVEGGFWIVSEGSGTVGDPDSPVESPNLLLFTNTNGEIEQVVPLPAEVANGQLRYGFEGVAVDGDNVVVAFQRAWTELGDSEPRLGIYNTVSGTWKFVFYPLDAPESLNGGWVGLSDLASVGEGKFYVLERDNQGGPDAVIKKVYYIDLDDFSVAEGTTITKTLVRDVVPDLLSTGGTVVEKVEGLAVDGDGNLWINNDNDGVDDNSGEQLLINLGQVV